MVDTSVGVVSASGPLAVTRTGCFGPCTLVGARGGRAPVGRVRVRVSCCYGGHTRVVCAWSRSPPQWGFDPFPSSFYQGRPQCGFYAEVAERSDYPNAKAFGESVASGMFSDVAEPPITYEPGKERLWQIEYTCDGQTLGIEVDLMEWKLKRRWTQHGALGFPMLESPMARQTRTGKVTVGDATLTCGEDAAWLLACPAHHRWVAVYHGPKAAPLTLTVPDGKVELKAIPTGTVVWDNGIVTVEAIGIQGRPKIVGGRLHPNTGP